MSVEVPRVRVLPAAQRFRTRTEHLDSRSTFSYGRHYDPTRTSHGLLLVVNDDVLRPGGGFPDHPHRDVELVTWVVTGALAHRDATGSDRVLAAGSVQRLSAGRGVVHSETQSGERDVRYVQCWVAPERLGTEPVYESADAQTALAAGGLVPLVAADGRGLLGTGQPAATLHAARLTAGESVTVSAAPYALLLVVTGAAELEGPGALAEGDTALLTDAGTRTLTATAPTEVLLWEMRARVAGP